MLGEVLAVAACLIEQVEGLAVVLGGRSLACPGAQHCIGRVDRCMHGVAGCGDVPLRGKALFRPRETYADDRRRTPPVVAGLDGTTNRSYFPAGGGSECERPRSLCSRPV